DGNRAVRRNGHPRTDYGILCRRRQRFATRKLESGRDAERDTESEPGGANHEAAPAHHDLFVLDLYDLTHDLALLHNALDGADNSGISAAAADVRAHVLDDLLARRPRIVLEQRRGAHD